MSSGSHRAGLLGIIWASQMDLNELENALRQRQRGQFRERATLIGCLTILVLGAIVVWLRWNQQ